MIDIGEVKLKTLANLPVRYGSILIKPKTLLEIIDFGFNNYLHAIATVTSTIKQWIPDYEDKEGKTTLQCLYDLGIPELIESYLDSLSYLLDTNVGISNNQVYFNNKQSVTFDQFSEIVEIIKTQNLALEKSSRQEYNPKTKKAKEMAEQMKKLKEKVNSLKKGNGENNLSFFDLIEIAALHSNISLVEIFELNYFQFNIHFNRLKLMKDYEMNINAFFSDKLEFKHVKSWLTKIENS